MSCFEGTEVYLVTDPKIECDKELATQFPERKEITKYKYVQWPALIQDGRVLQQWELYYHHKQPRPIVSVPPPPPPLAPFLRLLRLQRVLPAALALDAAGTPAAGGPASEALAPCSCVPAASGA